MAIPPALWNACDYVLKFNFKIAHIAGSVNTASDFLSRLELKVTSSDVADEEHFFFIQADKNDESEEQNIEPKEQSRQNAKQWVADEKPSSLRTSVEEFTKFDWNTTSYAMNGIRAKTSRARCRSCAEEYETQTPRPTTWKTGSVKYYQILIRKQLVNEVLCSLHGEFGKHPGIAKTRSAYRDKKYFPKMAQLIREWVMSCEQCIRESRIGRSFTRPPLQYPNDHITEPEDAMQTDLVPELPPSGGYENILTALDVFSRCLFAYPTANQDA